MSFAIRAEGLGKCYRIRHETAPRYQTLRDQLAARLRWGKPAGSDSEETFWALRDADFEIAQGERAGIIGRNGAGKSTLLKLLSRITEPTEGRVRIRGRVSSLLEVGTGFHPELTGRENIFLNGAILGMGRADIQRRFDEIVAFAEVEQFLDTPVKRYSSGMYVRLAFAVAAHLEPDLLFVDEVLAVGDVAFQRKCLGKMQDVAETGRTVVFVSHNLSAIEQLCGRVMLFERGRLVESGEPAPVLRSYLQLNSGQAADTSNPAGGQTGDLIRARDGALSIQQAFAVDANGVSKTVFNLDDQVSLRFEVTAHRPQDNLHFYLRLHSADGQQLFASGDWDAEGMSVIGYQPGVYELALTLPTPLLNAGCYSVGLEAVVPGTRYLLRADRLLSWQMLPVGGVGGMESVNRQGLIRPLLDWHIDRSGD